MKKFWKSIRVKNGKVESYYYGYIWKGGWNKADRVDKINDEVYNAIHVYTKKPDWGNSLYILPVYASASDLIAYGENNEAAFSKVWVKKEDLVKIIKKHKATFGPNN